MPEDTEDTIATSTEDVSTLPPEAETVEVTNETPTVLESSEATSSPEAVQSPSVSIEPAPVPSPVAPVPSALESVSNIQTSQFDPYIKRAREMLVLAREAIQRRRRQKLEKIMGMFEKKTHLTTLDVIKFLHISDSTVRHYFFILEKEGRVRKVGSTGRGVWYEKI